MAAVGNVAPGFATGQAKPANASSAETPSTGRAAQGAFLAGERPQAQPPTHPADSLDALCVVARLHQIAADAHALRHSLGLSNSDHIGGEQLVMAARHLGLKAKLTSCPLDRLQHQALPVLVRLRLPKASDSALQDEQVPTEVTRFVVLARIDEERALIQDPLLGRPTIEPLERFRAAWTGELILIASRATLAAELSKFDFSWFIPSLVNQLFNRSVRENIAISDPAAPIEAVIEAAKLAGAHDFISELPEGYDTLVGEQGGSLSGGQRQRVAIARALYGNPRILIFDEATSALDYESEAAIQRNMARICKGRTVIIIAHRLSAVRQADRILVMERGRIVEEGKHEALLQREDGIYAHLWQLQASSGKAAEVTGHD